MKNISYGSAHSNKDFLASKAVNLSAFMTLVLLILIIMEIKE